MDRRAFLGFLGTVSVASASPAVLPMEELSYLACKSFKNDFFSKKKEVVFSAKEMSAVAGLSHKLGMIRRAVGFSYFNLIGVDEMLRVGKNSSKAGEFTGAEMELLESLFYEEASRYGFYGEKILTSLTDEIDKKETLKVPYTGHYIYKGKALETYRQIRREVGESIILTSGVRSNVKQMDLFLRKLIRCRGNLSEASRSLAPAGYSYHSVGDFDVGKVGLGSRNFTSEFSKTDEYKRLVNSGHIKLRYTKGNPSGIRFEPWHIKVV